MAANRFESELQFNGTSAADFRLTLSRFAKRWLNTCIRSSPLHIPPKSRRQVGRGNWSREVLTDDQSQLGALPRSSNRTHSNLIVAVIAPITATLLDCATGLRNGQTEN